MALLLRFFFTMLRYKGCDLPCLYGNLKLSFYLLRVTLDPKLLLQDLSYPLCPELYYFRDGFAIDAHHTPGPAGIGELANAPIKLPCPFCVGFGVKLSVAGDAAG